MTHLTDQQLLVLTKKVIAELPFDENDINNMKHIAQCQQCYELLCCMMAVRDVSQHMGDFAAVSTAEELSTVVSEKVTAVIRLVINAVKPVLSQIDAQMSDWAFDRPLAMAGTRSVSGQVVPVEMLEDLDNSSTFVAFEPSTRTLIIQVDIRESKQYPEAYIKAPDGSLQSVFFTEHSGILRAEIADLDDAQYEIIMKK